MTQIMLLLNQHSSPAGDQRRTEHLRALRPAPPTRSAAGSIAIRLLADADRTEVEWLAGVDSAAVPAGDNVLGAEVDGKLVAALSLSDGAVVADPFRPSTAAIELLRLRASQLGGVEPGGRKRVRLSLRRRRPARAALAGSPPGGGGRLLQL